jgi:hypothetical protein
MSSPRESRLTNTEAEFTDDAFFMPSARQPNSLRPDQDLATAEADP